VVSPLFTAPKNPNSPELLTQNDIRALLTAFHRGDILVVAADKTPGIFTLALKMVKESSKLDLNLSKQWRTLKPKIHLVECKVDTLMIGELRATGKFPANWTGTLEQYLFISIKEAFEAGGSEVVIGLPNRYERGWVI
jgi:hypothetical protein